MGRLTRDPQIGYSQGTNNAMARYSIAVDRKFDREKADFINCVAFGKQAEFAEKYLRKGTKIAVVGRIQTGSYTNKDGQRVYTTDVVVEEQEFAESKNANSSNQPQENTQPNAQPSPSNVFGDDFINIPEGIDIELPFV